jgi:ABC-type phosphate transport system substrate-binding protein
VSVRAMGAGLVALLLMAMAALGLATQAKADFTTGKCAGPNIIGEGGSFANAAHVTFNNNFKNVFCLGAPGEGTINVEFRPNGSGAGVAAMKARTLGGPRFGQTDDPPTPAEVQEMQAGTPAATDDAKLHVLPVAVGSVVALVNFPNGCTSLETELPAGSRTAEENVSAAPLTATTDDVIRVKFTKAQYEAIWAQGGAGVPAAPYVTWGQVFPGLANTATCGQERVTRVVRFDQSGTSFAFKDYLHSINGSRAWKTTFSTVAPAKTRAWPGATFGRRDDCGNKNGIQDAADPEGPGSVNDFESGVEKETDNLTSACSKGNPELIAKLVATDGSVGYADLATAREKGLSITPEADDNDKYWIQVENGGAPGTFTEPTADAKGFRADTLARGSNCQAATFTSVPGSTFESWADTSGVNAPQGWGICTLTYALVFDDNSTAWGASSEEEQKARTLKDYMESIVSDAAQGALFGADYARLPNGILAIARKGVSEISWNKAGSGSGNPGGGSSSGGGGGGGSSSGGTVIVSNQFSVPRKTISSKTGGATFSVKLPGAGKLDVLGTAKAGKKKINVGHVVLTAGKAGTYSVTLKPSGAAKQLLSANGSLKVSLTFTFSPTGGTAKSTTSTVTLKLVKKAGK